MRIVNPSTEEIITQIQEDNSDTLAMKFHLLRETRKEWSGLEISKRIKIIKQFSEALESNIESLASILTAEVGKPLQQSRNEISGARNRIKWLTENAEKYLNDELMTKHQGLEEKISYEPLGVICNISAWNYPWLVGINVFVPALLAGNAVMYKPSEYATLTGLEIEKLLKQSGLPKGAFQVALGGKETGELLLTIPFDGYFFTGSYKTGKYIYEKAALKMVPCQLEMGGKDPLYVADDIADFKQVVGATADGAFYNNGQSCCSVERIYVHESVYDEYIKEFVNEVRSWKVGDPMEPDVYFGSLTRQAQITILENQVADALAKGARILLGGNRINRKGNYFEPTILVDVTHEMLVMKEESFGPIIGIMKVSSDEDAIRLMQDTEYGLTSAVFSADRKRAEKILQQINTGSGYWNCCDKVSASLPWSGRKHSGFGVALSHAGINSFVRPKAFHLRS